MSANKIITMKAWTTEDPEGTQKFEEGVAEIAVNVPHGQTTGKIRIAPPLGAALIPSAELHNMKQICDNFVKTTGKHQSQIAKKLREISTAICSASNRAQFAQHLLNILASTPNDHLKLRCLLIARKTCLDLTDGERALRRPASHACETRSVANFWGGPKTTIRRSRRS